MLLSLSNLLVEFSLVGCSSSDETVAAFVNDQIRPLKHRFHPLLRCKRTLILPSVPLLSNSARDCTPRLGRTLIDELVEIPLPRSSLCSLSFSALLFACIRSLQLATSSVIRSLHPITAACNKHHSQLATSSVIAACNDHCSLQQAPFAACNKHCSLQQAPFAACNKHFDFG